MPFCPNPDCPHIRSLGEPAEFNKGVAICSDCGSTLSETAPHFEPLRKPKTITDWKCPECGLMNSEDMAKCLCGYDANRPFKTALTPTDDKNERTDSKKIIESKYKTFWRRFGAGLIDGLIFLPLGFIDPWKYSQHIPIFLLVIWFIFHQSIWSFYSVLMHGRYGQTLGKMVCKIKVIDKSETKPITYRQAILRDSLLIVVGIILSMNMLPDVLQGKDPSKMTDPKQILFFAFWMSISLLWFAAELITMLTNNKRRAIHDYIAGSVVIKSPNKSFESRA